jgi:uncharacterized protein
MSSAASATPIVLDTSVLISAALFPQSVPWQALLCAFEHFEVVTSEAMLEELRASLSKPKHEQYASVATRLEFFDLVAQHARPITIATSIKVCRDLRDDKVLELAISANAPLIVSGDRDLLSLHPFRSIEILSPRQFVDEFR